VKAPYEKKKYDQVDRHLSKEMSQGEKKASSGTKTPFGASPGRTEVTDERGELMTYLWGGSLLRDGLSCRRGGSRGPLVRLSSLQKGKGRHDPQGKAPEYQKEGVDG